MADADAIKKICDIYDWHGKGQLDLFYLGDIMYALGFNITKKICMANGQQEEECKKFASFDEVVTMVNAALKTPEMSGNYHDYIELCKLYDKNENGTMMLAELETFLTLMGDEIPKEDCTKLLESLAGAEDEDGFFPYTPFLDKLCGK
jgi:myosin light chain 6